MRAAAARRAPFFAHVGVTGPHLPSIPAPWHAGLVGAWESARDFAAPRTPTFNERIATDHPLIAALPEIAANDTWALDRHHRDRLATLRSVDDLVAGVVDALGALGILDDTYVLVSSDHGDRRRPVAATIFERFRAGKRWNIVTR
jgi:arylsulfatase A-like enzyme